MRAQPLRDTGQKIKERVKMADICQKYGYEPNRSGFIRCPFHSGDNTPSLKINETGWHCFGCGRGGSVVDFVMELFECDFPEACKRLDADFGLGLYEVPTLTQYRKRQQEQRERERQRKKQQEQEEKRIQVLKTAARLYQWLREQPNNQQIQKDLDYLDRLWERLELPGAKTEIHPQGLQNMIYSHYGEGDNII